MARLILAAVCISSAISATTEASVKVGDRIKFGNGPGSRGGIFHIDVLNNGPGYDFNTFCVELEENIRFGTTYGIEAIALRTNRTGKTLTEKAAWLYTQYLDGTLSDFTPNASDANALQLAVWLAMGYSQLDIDNRLGSSFYSSSIGSLTGKSWTSEFNADKGSGAWSGTGDIYIMNLRKVNSRGDYTRYAQDQMVRIPHLPEPSTFVVWSVLGLASAGVVRRQRRLS